MDSPKLKNISIRIKRHPRTTESMDEAREQVSVKRCTVKLQRYNDDELRKMGKSSHHLEQQQLFVFSHYYGSM